MWQSMCGTCAPHVKADVAAPHWSIPSLSLFLLNILIPSHSFEVRRKEINLPEIFSQFFSPSKHHNFLIRSRI